MDDIYPDFASPKYPTDDESDSNTRLTPTALVESDPSESYHAETDPSEPSHLSVIHLTSDSSSSSATSRHTPPPVRGRGFIHTRAVPRERGRARGGRVVTLPLVDSGTVSSCLTSDVVFACEAEHEDSLFWL